METRTLKFHLATILYLFTITTTFAQPGEGGGISTSFFLPTEKTIYYKIGDATVPIRVIQYGEPGGIVFINLHDNEITSVQATRNILGTRGGTLIKFENGNQRVIRFRTRGQLYRFDPNRMFSREGIEQSLKENGRISPLAIEEVEKFAQRVLDLLTEGSSCIVALHNNTNENYSVKSYLPGSDREKDAREVYADPAQDPDDIAFTTDSLLFRKMADFGYNAIWQDNEKVKKDGSLSVWCGQQGRRYINIETEHGRLNQYIEMLNKLLEILDGIHAESPEKKEESR